jgi:hypothetical protein
LDGSATAVLRHRRPPQRNAADVYTKNSAGRFKVPLEFLAGEKLARFQQRLNRPAVVVIGPRQAVLSSAGAAGATSSAR